jgi:hypothetical protein
MSLSFRESNQRNLVEIVTLGFNPSRTCRQFRCVKRMRSNASVRITEIETLRLNPSAPRTRRFRRDPTNAELISSESAAMRKGAMRALRKRLACGVTCVCRFLRQVRWQASQGFRFRKALFASFSGIRERREPISLIKLRHFYQKLKPYENIKIRKTV